MTCVVRKKGKSACWISKNGDLTMLEKNQHLSEARGVAGRAGSIEGDKKRNSAEFSKERLTKDSTIWKKAFRGGG